MFKTSLEFRLALLVTFLAFGFIYLLIQFRPDLIDDFLPSNKRSQWIKSYLATYRSQIKTSRISPEACQTVIDLAHAMTVKKIVYDSKYYKIKFPNGDVDAYRGVCADVIVRSFRSIGFDLQQLVYQDKKENLEFYPTIWLSNNLDANIDHRRVPNLMIYFTQNHNVLPITNQVEDYQACDIIAWNLGGGVTHIGLWTGKNIIHHLSGHPSEENVLFAWKIIGHYRW